MKKLIKIFLLVLIISANSCNDKQDYETETKPVNNELLTALNAKYGVSSLVADFDLITNASNLKASNEWDFNKTTKFDFLGSDIKVFIVPSNVNDKFYVIKGNINSGELRIEKESYGRIEMDESGNGFFEILDNQNTIIDYYIIENGKPVSVETSAFKSITQLKKTSFCQREGQEGTSGCYKREADEFCDGFIGCAVLATNPQVHLLILAVCSC